MHSKIYQHISWPDISEIISFLAPALNIEAAYVWRRTMVSLSLDDSGSKDSFNLVLHYIGRMEEIRAIASAL